MIQRIYSIRAEASQLDTNINSTKQGLATTLTQGDYNKITRLTATSAKRTSDQTKQAHVKKFQQLTRKIKRRVDTTQTDQRTVVNHSQRLLSDSETKVLSLGLNFAVAPKTIPIEDIIQQLEPGLQRVDKTTADSARFEISRILSTAAAPKPNITAEERQAVKDLRSDQTIHIVKADKGNATVIMERRDYQTKIHDFFDTTTYSKLRRDPTLATERKLNQKLLSLHRRDHLPMGKQANPSPPDLKNTKLTTDTHNGNNLQSSNMLNKKTTSSIGKTANSSQGIPTGTAEEIEKQ